jgi:3-oxoacyl-[acyl-carrier protein] reductase
MDLLLQDKAVLVTGASGGIGRALAGAFAGEGARVVLHGHRGMGALEEWLAQQPWRERALALAADVTRPAEVDALFERARERFGRVDVCIANAGVWPPEDVPLAEQSDERVRRTLEVNLLGALWTARAFLRGLAADGPRADGHGACLLFTGSTAARFGERGHADYATSKAGLLGLMRSLKNEIVGLDRYARVNVIEPGWTVTEMTQRAIEDPALVTRVVRTMPVRQIARAVDIARVALMLASPAAARHVSGQVLTVAGGMEGRVLWDDGEIDTDDVLARLAPLD